MVNQMQRRKKIFRKNKKKEVRENWKGKPEGKSGYAGQMQLVQNGKSLMRMQS